MCARNYTPIIAVRYSIVLFCDYTAAGYKLVACLGYTTVYTHYPTCN